MNEPILIGLTPAAIAAAVGILANFGKAWFGIDITPDQRDSLNALLVWLVPILGAAGAWWARRKSTSIAAPVIPTGTTITVQTPPGEPDQQVTV